jgi:hypothetical protein
MRQGCPNEKSKRSQRLTASLFFVFTTEGFNRDTRGDLRDLFDARAHLRAKQ